MVRSRTRRNRLTAPVCRVFAVAKAPGPPDIGAMELNLPLTAILAVVSALFATGSGYMGAKMPDPKRGPRMLPWRFFMLLGALAAMLLVVHLLTLLGLKHDQPMRF